MADRDLRAPAEQAEFDAIDIPVAGAAAFLPAFRLASRVYPSQFFPSPRSRLTPISRDFPCVYLAEDRRTAVAEVWGDRFFEAAKRGLKIYSIAAKDAEQSHFLRLEKLPALRLCDVTDADVREKIRIDSGSFYATDLKLPQTWAERIARHPARFDGIQYRSRLTDDLCLVLWQREGGRDLERELSFDEEGEFLNCAEACSLAAHTGIRLSFPA